MIRNHNIQSIIKRLEKIQINVDENWAIYGTGNGAKIVCEALANMYMNHAIKYIIERDDKVEIKRLFQGIPVLKLSAIYKILDGIIIAAINNHEIIRERLLNILPEEHLKRIKIIDIFEYNTDNEKLEYLSYIEKNILKKSLDFVKFDEIGYRRKKGDPKVIAWYLPQFHQMEINNKFHGQGFTEWTNTSRAIPVFTGHYQPHIPYDVGYYDLLNIDTWKRQIYLAKHYGIYGFCIHYYWFSGKRIMEKPLELLFKHKELDMPFCLDWATENWTALWDGGNREIMLEQKLEEGDDQKFMEDILPYMKDYRYIKIGGRPVLVIYRIKIFKQGDARRLLSNFRKIAKENGFPDLYIMVVNAFDFDDDVSEWGADALVEFPPHKINVLMNIYNPDGYLNPYFNGTIYDVSSFVEEKMYLSKYGSPTYFRAALTSWDSSARKATSKGFIFYGFTPETFKIWLSDIIKESKKIHSDEENIVFVNSWNEWGEGSHLEPDMRYGYAYLQSLKEAIEENTQWDRGNK